MSNMHEIALLIKRIERLEREVFKTDRLDLTPTKIIEYVCHDYNLTTTAFFMNAGCRKQRYVSPRRVACKLLQEILNLHSTDIAKVLGKTDKMVKVILNQQLTAQEQELFVVLKQKIQYDQARITDAQS